MSNANLDIVRNFIFNDEVQKIINEINDNFLNLNILEITGMETQEIKHSNLLSWLFGDNEHGLGYIIFIEFLKQIYIENSCDDINLQNYIYLLKKNELEIFREKDNIDLLIVDKNNKKLFIIENKVFALERIDGEGGGQLNEYEMIIDKKYSNEEYKKIFIFLTPNLQSASNDRWLCASYQMISKIISNILDHKDLTLKVKIVLESYIDLLKKNNIIKDIKVQELCNQIWKNQEYKKALEIIIANRPNKCDLVYEIVEKEIYIEVKSNSGNYNYFFKLNEDSPLVYRFIYNSNGKGLSFVVTCKKEDINRIKSFNNVIIDGISLRYDQKSKSQFNYYIVSNYTNYYISEEEITKIKLQKLINELKIFDNTYINNNEI